MSTGNDGTADDDASVCVKAPSIKIDKTADDHVGQRRREHRLHHHRLQRRRRQRERHQASDKLPSNAGLNWTIAAARRRLGRPVPPASSPAWPASQILNCGGAAGVTVPPSRPSGAALHRPCHQRDQTAATGGDLPPADGTVNNTGHVTTGNDGTDDDDASVCVKSPNILIDKTADTTSVSAGEHDRLHHDRLQRRRRRRERHQAQRPLPNNPGLNWSIASAGQVGAGWAPGSLRHHRRGPRPADPQLRRCRRRVVPSGRPSRASTFTVHVISGDHRGHRRDLPADGTVNNTGHVTTGNDGTDDDDASVCVKSPSIHIDKTADATSVNAGRQHRLHHDRLQRRRR